MRIIHDELHCNAVRISGQEVDRLRGASLAALQAGLDVWLSPLWPESTREEYLPFLASVAEMANALPGAQESVVLVVGCEFTLFMKGLVAGGNGMERIMTVFNPLRRLVDTVRHGPLSRRLNRVLAATADTARARFAGRITYAAGTWEPVDWRRFDFASVDAYRDRNTRRFFPAMLAKPQRSGLPTVATELGCATYRGARDDGAVAWTKADRKADRLKESLTRDEDEQATEIGELLDMML
jgi:hypothetical protein